jgi:branched-chain amino acid aminotransferase
MGFSLALYPIAYRARFDGSAWREDYIEQPHKTPAEEAQLSEAELGELNERRNQFAGTPLVNYTTQYGMGCFEGLKAFPQKDGGLKIFRPGENAARFARSMKGLGMPAFPEDLFVRASDRKSVV